jgi:DNA repair exonuclease SbcCD ATPase subunit
LRIAHISDVHIRNLKFHSDYRRVFENLYKKLEELKPDLVVNTGDTAHTKTQISPEFVEMTSEHIRRVIEIAPYHIILGNHDLNLMNSDRQDAITPIVDSIGNDRVHLHKKSGLVEVQLKYEDDPFNLWVFGIGDSENYPTPEQWAKYKERINIGLFHGSISRCLTDSNWRMTHTEHDLTIFEGLDYVLMGDIHKQQFMDQEKRIGYAGSLVQQNFGEDINKGFLIWDIEDKVTHKVFPVFLSGSRKFYTVKLDEELKLPEIALEENARIRVSPPRQLTLVEQKEIERQVRKRYNPHDVITLSAGHVAMGQTQVGKKLIGTENLRQLAVQERLLRDWLKRHGIGEKHTELCLELNRKYQVSFEQEDETARNISWRLNAILWSNMFNYGENNVVDFNNIKGLTGIFAENSKGKSSFIDVIMEALYDKVTKNIGKNLHMINDNKDVASMVADITAEDKNYSIERKIDRVKYGKMKFNGDEKEWGKTSCDFYVTDPQGVKESLNADLRPGTERNIRQRLGNFEDFMLTSLTSQVNTMDIISCKETDRKKILYKFLDLDIFEQKGMKAKDDSREWYTKLGNLEDSGVQEHVSKYRSRAATISGEITVLEAELEQSKIQQKALNDQVMSLSSQKMKVDLHPETLAQAQSKIKAADGSITLLREKIGKKQAELLDYETRLSKISEATNLEELKAASDRYLDVRNELQQVVSRREKAEQTLQLHKKKLPLLKEVPCGDQFPECKFLVDAFNSQKKIPSWEEELGIIKSEEATLRSEHQKVEPLSKQYTEELQKIQRRSSLVAEQKNGKLELENYRLKVKDFEAKKVSAQLEIDRAAEAQASLLRNQELDEQISQLVEEKEAEERSGSKMQGRLNELNHERGGQETILTKLEAELSILQDVKDRCTAFEHYVSAMGKDGIAYDILTQKLPVINEEINKILGNSADFGVVIEHDPEEQSIRLYLQYGEYKPRILELGGGAEKMLASVAIRTALLSISNLPKTNMFIIDEGFGKLDPKNLESVGRMFDYLRTVFEHVIVISHIESMKDMVDNIIEITTDEEGYSHIEV